MKLICTGFQLFVIIGLNVLLASPSFSQSKKQNAVTAGSKYQCLPCGQECDNEVYDTPGKCAHCQMQLVKKSTVTFRNIKPSAICAYILKHPAVVLLDVRTKEEFEGKADPNFGTLKNSINIPVQELESRLSSIANLKNKEIIVYCSHSHRSPQASYLLTQNGFKHIINMSGGMSVMKDGTCLQ